MVMNLIPRTTYDKIFDAHVVDMQDEGTALLYIDKHLVHEVTSPQAFEGLRNAGRTVRRPDCTLATVDHNIPTDSRENFKNVETFISEPTSRLQVVTLQENIKAFGLQYFGMTDKRQGIIHVIGPEQGFTLPGTTVVCGDSHTSTHGAFGALAFGIGTSEVEHVLATQTVLQRKSKNCSVRVNGVLPPGVTSKDIALYVIGKIGTDGGTGCVIEFRGTAITALSMEARMSICNMSIEAGARAGIIAPDETTFEYLKGRPLAPKGDQWEKAVAYWRSLKSDPDAVYDKNVEIDASEIPPTVTWGTSPQDTASINGCVPDPMSFPEGPKRTGMQRSLEYMGLTPNTPMQDIMIDKVFIGSCTNSRIEDMRAAAAVVIGKKVASNIKLAMIVPGSGLIKKQAEAEGLDKIFKDAGFDWREAGCSMCLGMNPDQLAPKERCASTSNRNFEGRQGSGGRTHLCSPAMAAAAAITGHLADVRQLVSAPVSASGSPSHQPIILDPKNFVEDDTKLGVEEQATDAEKGPAAEKEAPAAAGMPPFTILKGIAAHLPFPNLDTDKIIPAKFLKTIRRTGLKEGLFYTMRNDPATGKNLGTFVLDREPWTKAKVLVVTGENFGCGSSREHAPWALLDFGITCILAPSFADIFHNNSFKNGVLPITLPIADLNALAEDAEAGIEIEVNLVENLVKRSNGSAIPFEIEPFRRYCLLNGLDDIGLTVQKESQIAAYEAKRLTETPWLSRQDEIGKALYSPTAKVTKPTVKASDW